MKKIVILAALAVAGCAGKPPPEIITRTETVEVPIAQPVPCLGDEDVEALRAQAPTPVAQEPKPETVTGVVGLLRAKLKEWEEAFWPTVDEVIEGCSKIPDLPDG